MARIDRFDIHRKLVPVRQVGLPDLADVVAIFLDCWRLRYREVMPAELVERMSPEAAEELWARSLADPGMEFLGAEGPDGRLAGIVGFRIADPGVGYVSSLYVSPHTQGGGFGRHLLTAAERGLAELGATTARLWVFEQNEPSRRFYERSGWEPDGTRETLPDWGVPQIGMAKRL